MHEMKTQKRVSAKFRAICTTFFVLLTAIASANPSVTGNTISWPDNGWYQVQRADNFVSICEGGSSCEVTAGNYIVINQTTGQRFTNVRVGSSSGTAGLTVLGNTISWPDDGWYQVQNSETFESVCQGGRSCDVADGTYIVINHNTGERFSNIVVSSAGTSSGSPEESVVTGSTRDSRITVNGSTISWPDDGWYQVQRADTFETLCAGGQSCEVSNGIYNVINLTTQTRFENISVSAPVTSDTANPGETIGGSDQNPEPATAPDVYLLVGQSNMVGWSETNSIQAGAGQPDAIDPRIFQLNVSANDRTVFSTNVAFSDAFTNDAVNTAQPLLIPAQDPLHEPLLPGQSTKPGLVVPGATVGPGLSFAKAALADTDQSIYLVPAAFGGTGFCAGFNGHLAWNAAPTSDTNLGGTGLADRAITRLNITLRETGGTLKGILWHQGENDGINPECAATYADNLAALVARFRSSATTTTNSPDHSRVPFIVGTMSRGSDERGNFSNFGNGGKAVVDAVHRNIAQIIPFSDWVNNDDLVPPAFPCGQSACFHFGAAAFREMGVRYYSALKRVSDQ